VINGSSSLAESLKDEVSVREIIDSPLVIYSFNKNNDMDLSINETISVFMAEYLSTKKHHFRKRLGMHSMLVAEEVQRYKSAGKIVQFLASQTTGARSQNVMVMFLLNSLAKLQEPDFAPIRSNVTTTMLGLLSDEDIEIAVTMFGAKSIESMLKKISDEQNVYRNAFAVKYNTGYQYGQALMRAYLPKDMNKMLATRTILE
jgi:hypothetical protein